METSVMFQLCQETIWLDPMGRRSTYCMRQRGHEGKHNIENSEPPESVKLAQEIAQQ